MDTVPGDYRDGVLKPLAFHLQLCGFNFQFGLLNVTLCSSSHKKANVKALPKVMGFVQVLWFPPTANGDRVGNIGDPILVAKLNKLIYINTCSYSFQ